MGADTGAAGADGFFACASGALAAAPGAALAVVVVVAGRAVAVVRVEDDREARGAARDVGPSTEGRVVAGRFAAAVAAAAGRVVVGRAGDRVAAPAARAVRRTEGFLFSSPDVTEDRSGSASDAVALEASPVLRTVVPGAGRVGGLLRLEPAVVVREAAPESGLDAAAAVRVVLVLVLVAAGRRTAAPAPTTGRRGGTGSLEVVDEALEAILRRVAGDAGAAGLRAVLGGDAGGAVVVGSASLALGGGGGGGGESMAAAANDARATSFLYPRLLVRLLGPNNVMCNAGGEVSSTPPGPYA